MGIIFKDRKFKLVACGLWLVACGLWLVACKQEETADRGTSGGVSSSSLPSNVAIFRTALVRKIIDHSGKNESTLREIRQYDFELPDSADYKNSKEWSIFEKDAHTLEFSQRFRSIINSLSNEGYVISLANRVEAVGTDQPDLLFILPGVEEKFCTALLRNVLNLKYNAVVVVPVHISGLNPSSHSDIPDNDTIVTISGSLSPVGCLKSQDKFYYYQVLYEL